MQRLPNVHPTDAVAYPNGIGNFKIGAANEGSKVLLYNATQLSFQLDFLNGHSDTLHPWEANYWPLDADTKQIQWQIDTDSLNVTTPPMSAIFLTLYDANEKINGTYPVSLPYQTSLGGGSTSTTVSSTNSIVNDGSPLNTSIVEATPTGQVTSAVSLTNDGILKLLTVISGTLVQLIKTQNTGNPLLLGAVGTITEMLGNVTVDGSFIAGATQLASTDIFGALRMNNNTVSGITTATATTLQSNALIDSTGVSHVAITTGSGVTRIQDATQIALQVPGGTGIISVLSTGANISGALAVTGGTTLQSGLTVTGNSVFFINGSISRISTGTYTSVIGAHTTNHGLGATPQNVLTTGGSSTGTATTGSDSYGATTFTSTEGAASVTMRFRAERG